MSRGQFFTQRTSSATRLAFFFPLWVLLLLTVFFPLHALAADAPPKASPAKTSEASSSPRDQEAQATSASKAGPSPVREDPKSAAEPPSEKSKASPTTLSPKFRPSENLAFDVSYLGIPVGTLDLTIAAPIHRAGVETWPLIANAKTAAAFVFFPVKDRYVSWFNPQTGLSVGNDFLANENREIRRERVTFDRQKQKAIFRRDGGGKASKKSILDIPPNAQDLLAMVYRFRMAPMNVGDVFESPICTGQRTFIAKATVMGKETVTVDAGQFSTKRVHVEVAFSGQLASKRELRMFFTDDERHIPIRVDAEFFLGKLVADLTRYSSGF